MRLACEMQSGLHGLLSRDSVPSAPGRKFPYPSKCLCECAPHLANGKALRVMNAQDGKVAALPLELDSKQLAKLLLAFMRDTYRSRPVHPHHPLQFKGPLQQRRPKSTG